MASTKAAPLVLDAAAPTGVYSALTCDNLGVSPYGVSAYEVWSSSGDVVPPTADVSVASGLLEAGTLPLTPLQQHLLPTLQDNRDLAFMMRTHKVLCTRLCCDCGGRRVFTCISGCVCPECT